MKNVRLVLLVLASALVLTAPKLPAGTPRRLADSFASDATALTFERPPAQGPGTPGGSVIFDPTIQPFVSPGVPTPLLALEPIDLQGNGRPDLIVCHGSSFPPMPAVAGPCRVLRPQSEGSIVEITRQLFGAGALPSLIGPSGIVSGDFNRDRRPDIFISGGGYDMSPWLGETNRLLISNADGTYTDRSATLPQTPAFHTVPTVGDINADGDPDIYVGAIFGANRVGPYFLLGRGDGTFTQKTGGLPAQIQNLQEKFGPSLLIDVDRDGSLDLVLGTSGDGGYIDNIVLFNDGTGDFTRRPRLVLPHGSQLAADNSVTANIASLDVNLDGRPDLLMLLTTRSFLGFGLQVLIDQGNGTFTDETTARLGPSSGQPTGPRYPFIRLADFNGDGLQDFYLPYAYDPDPSAYPRFWLNNGNGTFASIAPSALPVEFGSAYASLYAVDFDGDGRPDIVQVGAPPRGPLPAGEFITYRSFLNRTAPAAVTSNVTFPPRNETNDFNTQLENLYRDRLGARPIAAYVDLEGANVWLTEYARYRVGLCSHGDAMTRVFRQITAGVVSGVCATTPAGAIPFPPRNEGLDFMNQLDAVYRDGLRRAASSVYVNNEGRVVWILEYLRYRLNGCGHADATTRVFQQVLGQGIQPTCR